MVVLHRETIAPDENKQFEREATTHRILHLITKMIFKILH